MSEPIETRAGLKAVRLALALKRDELGGQTAMANEAAQAACRDKTIEECAAIVDAAGLWKLTGKDRDRAIASAIRTLKTKEPTNG